MILTEGEGAGLVSSASGSGATVEVAEKRCCSRAGWTAPTRLPAHAAPCNGVSATVPDVTVTGGDGVAAKWPEAHDRKYSCPAALQPTSSRNIQEARHTSPAEVQGACAPARARRAQVGTDRQ